MKKKGRGSSWFIQQAFFLLWGATAARSAAPHGDNKHPFFSNSVLWVAAFTWKAKWGLWPEPLWREGKWGAGIAPRCLSTFSSKAAAFQLSWVWVSERSHADFHGPPRSASHSWKCTALRGQPGNLALLWDKSELKQRLNHEPLQILPSVCFFCCFVGFFFLASHSILSSIVLAPKRLRWRSTQWMKQWVFKVL